VSEEFNEKILIQQAKKADVALEEIEVLEITKAQEDYEKSGYTSERDLIISLLGEVKAHQAHEKVATVMSLSKLMYIKENKLYRYAAGFEYTNSDGKKVITHGTWEGFLKPIGFAVSTIDERIRMAGKIGIDAYEAMVSIGIGPRAFRKLRQLPEEEILKIADGKEVDLGDKDAVLNLIDGLSEKHIKEKQALQKEITNLKQKDETNDRLFADKDKKINELDRQLDRLKNKAGNWVDQTFEINMEITKTSTEVLQGIDKLNILRDIILNEDFGEEDRAKAIEAMAIVYYDAVSQVMEQAAWLMKHCDAVFEGYKLGAKPLIDLDYIYVNAPIKKQ